jgi:glycerate dehydrogenase
MIFALILEITNQVGSFSRQVHNGKWTKSKDFCFYNNPLIELKSLCLGVIGYGKIGKSIIKKACAFDMNIKVFNRTTPKIFSKDIIFYDLNKLLKESNIISINCPLNQKTKNMISSAKLSLMKKTSFLINTGRGGLIGEHAVAKALNNNLIAGAGLDVLFLKPPNKNNPLLKTKNCFITPHIAWATKTSIKKLLEIAFLNINFFINSKIINIIN